jgi:fructose-1,6-bisphosphatase/inositol monophosphatase family enzyme
MTTSERLHKDRIPPHVLIKHAIAVMHDVLVSIERDTDVKTGDSRALQEVETTKEDNITREADETAEGAARFLLKKYLRNTPYANSLEVWGEESICEKSQESLSFRSKTKTVALLDMIDGTDLVNRHLGNWCAAMAFIYPPQKEILASVIALPTREFYVAEQGKQPYKVHLRTDAAKISPGLLSERTELKLNPDRVLNLTEAAVCFYGQKAANLLTVFKSLLPMSPASREAAKVGDQNVNCRLGEYLYKMSASKPRMRIYTLAGNPMMVRVADGTIDAVFELRGQKPHDVVPGAFIAKQANAVFWDLDGNDIDIAEAALDPNASNLRYVLAGSKSLAEQVLRAITDGS